MNSLSKLFEILHLSRGEMALRKSHRRRRARRQGSALSCETLEPKQLLAADVAVQFSDIVLDTTDPVTVALEGTFEDTAVSGTVVKFETNAPLTDNDFYVELTSNTPLTNANFLSYVNSGAYDNSKFHRSVSDFVLQGGGFKHPTVSADQPGSDPVAIVLPRVPFKTSQATSMTRGTIAMAKLGGQPDSATSQFFFNLSENSFLDSDNGGYTAFGDVLGSGMTVVDTMGSALTYDAQTYYSNTALSDLPLWNINQDNIVQPQDFVKIENADVVTESALMTYTVTSSDTAKLVASFDSNGDLVLTPVGGATGSVDVTVTAASRLDSSSDSDTFSVQLNSPAGPTITPIESLGSTVLGKDATGKLYADVQAISYGGQHLTETQFATFTPRAVEDFGSNGGKQMLFEKIDGSYSLWSMTSSWAYQSNIIVGAGDTSAINAALVKFGLADPAITLTAIEAVGNTVLNQDQDGKLYAGNSPIYNTYNGESQLTVNPFNGHTVVAVEDLGADGKKLVMQTSTQIIVWALDADWKRDLNVAAQRISLTDTATVEENEFWFGTDFNGGGAQQFLGLESAGSTVLQKDADGKLYADGAPIYNTYNGESQLTVNPFNGHTVVAVEDLGADGKKLVMQTSTQIIVWALDADWKRDLNVAAQRIYLTSTSIVEAEETSFGIDFNGGGIGSQAPVLSNLESAGSTVLQKDAGGKLYADGAPIYNTYNGESQLTVNPFNGHTVVAIEDLGADGKKLVMQTSTQIIVWALDADWKRDLNVAAERIYLTSTSIVEAEETSFGIDFNGGGIGSQAPVLSNLETAGSTVLQKDADGKLYADGAPIYNTYNGESQLTVNPFNGHTVVAIEDLGADGKKLVMQTSTQIIVWALDADWKRDLNVAAERIYLTSTSIVEAEETSFGIDFNGGGIGSQAPVLSNLEAAGSTVLQKDADGKLYADGAPIYNTYNGESQLTVNPFNGHTVVAVEDLGADGKKLVMQTSTQIIVWALDADWKRDLNVAAQRISLTDTATVEENEFWFGTDFNGGGAQQFLGLESAGSTVLQKDADGKLYADGAPIYNTYNGESQLTVNPFNGHTVVAIEDLGADGKKLVMQTSTQIIVWALDADWKRDLNVAAERIYLSDTDRITPYEQLFDVTF